MEPVDLFDLFASCSSIPCSLIKLCVDKYFLMLFQICPLNIISILHALCIMHFEKFESPSLCCQCFFGFFFMSLLLFLSLFPP